MMKFYRFKTLILVENRQLYVQVCAQDKRIPRGCHAIVPLSLNKAMSCRCLINDGAPHRGMILTRPTVKLLQRMLPTSLHTSYVIRTEYLLLNYIYAFTLEQTYARIVYFVLFRFDNYSNNNNDDGDHGVSSARTYSMRLNRSNYLSPPSAVFSK